VNVHVKPLPGGRSIADVKTVRPTYDEIDKGIAESRSCSGTPSDLRAWTLPPGLAAVTYALLLVLWSIPLAPAVLVSSRIRTAAR